MEWKILTNAKIVCTNEVIHGTLVMGDDGLIKEISHGNTSLTGALDCEGDYLLPGMVELHTDNLEKYFTPRPGVTWPSRSAVITHDAQVAAAGITSVFDAVSLGDIIPDSDRLKNLQSMIHALHEAREAKAYRADHFLHLRCEVSCESTLELFNTLVDEPMVKLVSIMDHSPGQRQFVKEAKYRQYYQGKYGLSEEQLQRFILRQKQASQRFSEPYRTAISSQCQQRHIPLASHDDATIEHVIESVEHNMAVAEFPTTVAAAKASHEKGLKVLMGAPNIVRGGSHSGNVAAAELAKEGVLDILSSDYYPSSLLDAAFRLADLDNDYDLPTAIRTVSDTPARSVGLIDRGQLSAGLLADVIRAKKDDHILIQHVWKQGKRVF